MTRIKIIWDCRVYITLISLFRNRVNKKKTMQGTFIDIRLLIYTSLIHIYVLTLNSWIHSRILFTNSLIVIKQTWSFSAEIFLLYRTSSIEVPWKLPYLGFENFKFEKCFHTSHIILTSVAVAVIIRGSERDQ